jgi:hypothetical protein
VATKYYEKLHPAPYEIAPSMLPDFRPQCYSEMMLEPQQVNRFGKTSLFEAINFILGAMVSSLRGLFFFNTITRTFISLPTLVTTSIGNLMYKRKIPSHSPAICIRNYLHLWLS